MVLLVLKSFPAILLYVTFPEYLHVLNRTLQQFRFLILSSMPSHWIQYQAMGALFTGSLKAQRSHRRFRRAAQRFMNCRAEFLVCKLLGRLGQVSNEVVTVFLLLQTCKSHLCSWNVLLRVSQVLEHGLLVPSDTFIDVRVRVGVAGGLSRLAAKHAVQVRANLVWTALLDCVALQAACLEQSSTFFLGSWSIAHCILIFRLCFL